MIILPMPGCERFGRIGLSPEVAVGAVEVHRFPDGEVRVRLAGAVDGEEVILVAALDRPDEKILPVLFAAATARELGAAWVGLVRPLPTSGRTAAFIRAKVSARRQFAELLSRPVDWLVTVDPHLAPDHRLSDLFDIPAEAVRAAPLLAEWIREHVEAPLRSRPRRGEPPVGGVHRPPGGRALRRLPQAPDGRPAGRDRAAGPGGLRRPPSVLVDDMIASAGTMAAAVRALRAAGWPAPTCLAVHAVFADGAREALRAAGPAAVATCDTIAHRRIE